MFKRKRDPLVVQLSAKLTLVLAFFVSIAFFAQHFWVFDIFSNFVIQYAIISAILFIPLYLSRKYAYATLAISIFVFQCYQVAPLFKQQASIEGKQQEEIKVLQYNVKGNNKNVDEMAKWVISNSEDVDIVVLLEVTNEWRPALERIKWTYPYHISRETDDNFGIAVLSKLLIDELQIQNVDSTGIASAVIKGSTLKHDIPFVLKAIHTPPSLTPGLAETRNNILMLSAENMANEKIDHKMLIGDLNTTRYSPWFTKVAELSGLRDSNEGLGLSGDGFVGTWPAILPKPFGIAIDNLLISKNIIVKNKEYGPSMGSDHFPVITTFAFLTSEEDK